METENYQMKGFEIIDVDIDEIRKKQKEERESNMMDNFDEIYEDLKQSARMVFEHSLFPAGKPLEIYYQVIDDIEFLFHVFPSRKNMIIINRSEKSEEFDKMKESVIALNKILGIRFEW